MKKTISIALGALFLAGTLLIAACASAEKNSKYEITAEYLPEESKLTAEMQFTFVNDTQNALDDLRFELYPNAYREGAEYAPVSELYRPSAYYAGESYGGIEMLSVDGGTAWEVCGEDENILSVSLAEPVYPDGQATLSMSFEVTLAKVNHRLGVGEHTVNLANFYPILCAYSDEGWREYVYSSNGDPFASECADYDVRLTVPDSYTVACGGEAVLSQSGGKKTYNIMSENVRDCAFILGTQFFSRKTDVGGTEVEYYWFDDDTPDETLAAAADSFRYYSETFGEYAYDRYAVVQADFCYGGMEYPMMSLISASLREGEVVPVVVHETAHQWWYAAVGNDQFCNAWMDEGLAQYSSALFFDAHPEYGVDKASALARAESAYRSYFSVVQQLHGTADTSMSRPLTDFSGEYEYGNIAYHKGMILFDRLCASIGEKRFFAGLRDYYRRYTFRMAKPEDMIACFERAGADAEGFFASFVDGACVI